MKGASKRSPRRSSRYISPEHSVKTDMYKPTRKITNYAAMPDLPEEARKCLVTVEKLSTMGKGTLADSIWAFPEDKIEIPRDNRKIDSIKKGPASITTKTTNPTYPTNPKAGRGTQIKSDPKGNGLAASRWATPSPSPQNSVPKTCAMETMKPATPSPKVSPKVKPGAEKYILPHLRGVELEPDLKPEAKVSQSRKQPAAIETTQPVHQTEQIAQTANVEPAIEKHILPHLRGIEPEQNLKIESKVCGPNDIDPKNETHLPPHLRHAPLEQQGKAKLSTKSNIISVKLEEDTNTSYLLPHIRAIKEAEQRQRVLPLVSGVDHNSSTKSEYDLSTSPVAERVGVSSEAASIRSDVPEASSMISRHTLANPEAVRPTSCKASSTKSNREVNVKAAAHWGTKLASAGEFMSKVNARKNDRDAAAKTSKSIHKPGVLPSSVKTEHGELIGEREPLDSSVSNKPKEAGNEVIVLTQKSDKAQIVDRTSDWEPRPLLQNPKLFTRMILSDLTTMNQIPTQGDVLTKEALVKTTGSTPRACGNVLEDWVSDAGVVHNPKEIVRAAQGRPAAEEFLDWDGSWMPPVCDWEYDRTAYDNSGFVSQYIEEWRAHAPSGPGVAVDTKSEDFYKIALPIQGGGFAKAVYHSPTIPDTENSESEEKRQRQTACSASYNYTSGRKRYQGPSKLRFVANAYNQVSHRPQRNPFAPKIATYLRPATVADAAGVASVYNYYANNTHLTEDQNMLADTDAAYMITLAQKDKLPFIVAILGKQPVLIKKQDLPEPLNSIALPSCEMVIGFASAESFNYGFTGERTGRSRATVNLQLFVHPDHTRRGLGRNLLDHLVHIMNPGYAFKNACSWVNPENDEVHRPGGAGLYHQMIIQLPVLGENDPGYSWIKTFLYNKFFFTEEGRLKSVGRSSKVQGPAKWLDLVLFQAEASNRQEFSFDN